MSDNGYDWMTDARTAGEERREWLREGRIRGLLSLRFWSVYDAVRYGYGLLDRSDSLPGFDLIDAMDAAAERETYWGVNGGMLATLTELAEQEWMTDRSTPDEWIAFFEIHSLPGAEIFKRAEAADTVKPAVEPAPLDDDGSDFQLAKSAEPEEMRQRLWSNADRNDKGTWPKKDDAVKLLMNEYGLSKTLAERTDTLLRPKWAKSRGRPSNDEKG